MDKKLKNFFSESTDYKNKTLNNKKYKSIKNDKSKRNNNTIYNNETTDQNNTVEIRDILNRLIKIKQKIKEINTIKKKKVKINFEKFEKLRQDQEDQEDYSNHHNNFKIKLRNNKKTKNLEETDKNEIKNYKTETNFKASKTKNGMFNSTDFNQNKKIRAKLSLDINKVSNFNFSENKSSYIKNKGHFWL